MPTLIVSSSEAEAKKVRRWLAGTPYSQCKAVCRFVDFADLVLSERVDAVVYCTGHPVGSLHDMKAFLARCQPEAVFADFRERGAEDQQAPRLLRKLKSARPCGRMDQDTGVSGGLPADRIERLLTLEQKAPVPIVVLDQNGEILYANPETIRLIRILGITMSGLSKALPTHVSDYIRDCLHTATTDYVGNAESEIGGRTVLWSFQAVRPQSVVFAFGHDVTNVLRTRADLAASEARYQTLIDSLGDVVVQLAPGATVHFVSSRWARLLGHPVKTTVGTNFLNWVDPQDAPRVEGAINNLFAEGTKNTKVRFRATTLGGSTRLLNANMGLMKTPGKKKPFVTMILSDITERQILEDHVNQSQRLEAIGQLAGGVAHDFNNLLTGIRGYVDLSLSGVDPNSETANDLRQAQDFCERAATLTRQLLIFSRRQKIRPVAISVNAIVQSAVATMRALLGHTIEIVTKLDPGLETLFADPAQVEQMLVNLGFNAKNAMPGGGRLTITTANARIDKPDGALPVALNPGIYVLIEVSDTGVGMTEEIRQHIFEPFVSSAGHRGTGLGLAVAYSIAQQHKGQIAVESTLGEGSTFKIYLPVIEGEEMATGKDSRETAIRLRKKTVLIVDNNSEDLRLLAVVVGTTSVNVLTAESATEARQLVEKGNIRLDLLVANLALSDEPAPVLFTWLRQRNPNLKALYLSDPKDTAITSYAEVFEQNLIMQKPVDDQALLERVRALIGKETQLHNMKL
ncbi:MAG: PAS domain S-box protein [Candidatus Sumerlaeaceae bacterium]|nr:PAS domain S-box protein [Candidatus Sumerlaeaceae bacterium]